MKIAIVTGSAGLVGSQACIFLHEKGFKVVGIDNNLRAYFFGMEGSTLSSRDRLINCLDNYEHNNLDIRDFFSIEHIFKKYKSKIQIVIHAAAQPSHDWAAKEPLTDFTVNSLGTINLLEATRLHCPEATFIFTSTNKVYGDRPNSLNLTELESRFEFFDSSGNLGSIDETMSIDNTKHSIFGASKVAADIMCQEYGKYFNLNIGIFRGGCLTGPNHAGTSLHGFLSYLVKCIVGKKHYVINGYKGKQVRDNIHSWDLVNMFWSFHKNPKAGQVYNVGGGRDNSISILEAINKIKTLADSEWKDFSISDTNRIGDHIWYISNLNKFKNDYPDWNIQINLNDTLIQMINFERGHK